MLMGVGHLSSLYTIFVVKPNFGYIVPKNEHFYINFYKIGILSQKHSDANSKHSKQFRTKLLRNGYTLSEYEGP